MRVLCCSAALRRNEMRRKGITRFALGAVRALGGRRRKGKTKARKLALSVVLPAPLQAASLEVAQQKQHQLRPESNMNWSWGQVRRGSWGARAFCSPKVRGYQRHWKSLHTPAPHYAAGARNGSERANMGNHGARLLHCTASRRSPLNCSGAHCQWEFSLLRSSIV